MGESRAVGQPPPLRLAVYMASSALRSANDSDPAGSSAVRQAPMEAPTVRVWPRKLNGSHTASCRAHSSHGSATGSGAGTMAANSSPPSRAVTLPRSPARAVVRLVAVVRMASSPAAWPKVSLSCLKPSRFMTMTACGPRTRARAARCSNAARVHSPDSGSRRAVDNRRRIHRLWTPQPAASGPAADTAVKT